MEAKSLKTPCIKKFRKGDIVGYLFQLNFCWIKLPPVDRDLMIVILCWWFMMMYFYIYMQKWKRKMDQQLIIIFMTHNWPKSIIFTSHSRPSNSKATFYLPNFLQIIFIVFFCPWETYGSGCNFSSIFKPRNLFCFKRRMQAPYGQRLSCLPPSAQLTCRSPQWIYFYWTMNITEIWRS